MCYFVFLYSAGNIAICKKISVNISCIFQVQKFNGKDTAMFFETLYQAYI